MNATGNATRSATTDGRIPTLDGIRGLAILLVMALHFTDRTVAGGIANRVFVQLTDIGWIGVDLFFVLSGYLITGLLLDAKGSPHYFRNFWARRALRIFPAYYACLLGWFVIVPLIFHPHSQFSTNALAALSESQAWFWSYLSNWKMGLDGQWSPLGTSVYWSLAIEEQFYLIWPTVVLLSSSRTLTKICVALIVTALVTRLYLSLTNAHPILIYTSTPTRMDTLATGALVAVAARDDRLWSHVQRYCPLTLLAALGSLALMWLWIGAFSEYHALMQTAGFTVLCLLFGALIAQAPSAPADSGIARFFSNRTLRFFGKYSYAMYLFHETIAVVLVPRLGLETALSPWMQVARLAVLSAVTVLAALLSWHVFEKYFLALKRYLPSSAAVSGGSAPSADDVRLRISRSRAPSRQPARRS